MDGTRNDFDPGWTVRVGNSDALIAAGSNLLVGNGFLGYRGTTPEQRSGDHVALVVAGTYDCADGHWRELTTAPNPLHVEARVGETPIHASTADSAEVGLDLRSGEFTAHYTQTVDGIRFDVEVERFASYERLGILAQRWTVTADRSASIDLGFGIDGDVWSLNGQHLPSLEVGRSDDTLTASGTTVESGIDLVVSVEHVLDAEPETSTLETGDRTIHRRMRIALEPGTALTIDSIASISTSSRSPRPHDLGEVRSARDSGFEALRAENRSAWSAIWDRMDVRIDGPTDDQLAVRFAAYHNRIATPAHDERLPLGARGLSCQAYQGAAFWDQEVYNLPALLFTEPELARSLLAYRHHTLDGARRKARRLGYDGAFFAWISGDTGDELCPDFFFRDIITGRPIRTHFNDWQIHVAPDIVDAIARYVDVTGDDAFIVEHGAEIAFEVARFLFSFVRYDEWRGVYHCIRVLGPDEWHENVDDNAFTNHQVHSALTFAIHTWNRLESTHPGELRRLSSDISLARDEIEGWKTVRDGLLLPQPDPETQVIEQFDGFFELEDATPEALRGRVIQPGEYWGYPNGVAVHTQVSKQADVPMLLWLHGSDYDVETKRANYHYYEPRCSHDSSLSHAAFGMLAVDIGAAGAAYEHFHATSRVDLGDSQHAVVGGTFIGGIHTAACGGTYQLAVRGFGGLGFRDGRLTIDPRLPPAWKTLSYPVSWRGNRLDVRIDGTSVAVRAATENPGPVEVLVRGRLITIEPGSTGTA